MAIKRNLNLRELKMGTSEKHNTIYDKAMRIIKSGFHSPELSYLELKVIAEKFRKFGLSTSVAISGDMTVRSKCDDWTIIDEGRFYTLYHEVTVVGVSGKPRKEVHVQDVFEDLTFLFASIVSHDDYKMSKKIMEQDDIEKIRVLINDVNTMESLNYEFEKYAC